MAIRELRSEDGTKTYQVVGMLGEGGQGKVIEVSLGQERYAVKWYDKHHSQKDQHDIIEKLIPKDPGPKGGGSFVWPMSLIIAEGSSRFGYLMDKIDREKFRSLGELMKQWAAKPFDYKCMAVASANIARCFRALHAKGMAYRDINRDNILIDHTNGDIRVCDNDNVGVSGEDKISIIGTMEYMAPELILKNETSPSQQTDLYSLSVYLFYLWMWHHPLEGKKEAQVRVWDDPAKKKIYAEESVFIFNEQDTSNNLPNETRYKTCRDRWSQCPKQIKELFTIAFTDGLKSPCKRVAEGQWIRAFNELEDTSYKCRHCKAFVFLEFNTCWRCLSKLEQKPAKLCVTGTNQEILLTPGRDLVKRHFDKSADEASAVLGKVGWLPTLPRRTPVIENLVEPQQTWKETTSKGASKQINHGDFATIALGTSITIDGMECRIIKS
jgi:eukaryotic-like serine/threonine-protein kinase